jgi:predicted secreted protein
MRETQFARRAGTFAGVGGLIALVLLFSGCWFLPTTLDDTADGTVQSVNVGDRINIRLPGNASTGHQWIRVGPESFDGSPLAAIAEGEYEQEHAPVCGGPGAFVFRYEAVTSGTITLSYVHRRPWEDEAIGKYSVIIWVR